MKKNPSRNTHLKNGPSKLLESINNSIDIDQRMYKEDIDGSIAHATMLGKQKIISKNVINLIPKREFLAGIPEIIKAGVIDNNIITKMLINNKQKCLSRDFRFMSKLIQLSLKTKIKFFKNDIYENSKRLNLNFGHTFAHAIEMSVKTKNNDIIRHGEAVGIGMLCEIYYSEGRSKKFKFLSDLLSQYNLPTSLKNFPKKFNKNLAKKEIFKNIFLDKKRIGKYPRIIKILKLGKSRIIEMKDNTKIKQTINNVIF